MIKYKIKISIASILLPFQPCKIDYIKNVCHGRCCESSKGIMVTVHESEKENIKKLGAELNGNFIIPKNKLCSFKTEGHLCGVDNKKPFGCMASPFTLNKNATLIVRNRYKLLCCFKTIGAKPAYIAHKRSLVSIIGMNNYNKLCNKISKGRISRFITMKIDKQVYTMLMENDRYKRGLNEKEKRTLFKNKY